MHDKSILIGTHNSHKLKEIAEILADHRIKAISPHDLAALPEVEENGASYLENALLKARAFSRATGLACIADDTGLEVDALQGEPGMYSARWAGVSGAGRYRANNEKMLARLAGRSLAERGAVFICVIVLVSGDKQLLCCEGRCEGRITLAPRGENGFGYDPLFEVPEYGKTFAELDNDVKNKISHRARALAQLKSQLKDIKL